VPANKEGHCSYKPSVCSVKRLQLVAIEKSNLLNPTDKRKAHQLFFINIPDNNNIPIGIDRLIVAYHRAPNIRDHLFHRKFNQHPGPAASQHNRRAKNNKITASILHIIFYHSLPYTCD
jgi:hypothetical protein